MRISKISIKNLFGTFNHDIILNNEERVTIIIGPNGYGKTTTLKLINSLVLGDFNTLYSTPFDELKVEFIDGSSLAVDRKCKSPRTGGRDVTLTLVHTDFSKNQRDFDLQHFLSPKGLGLPYTSFDELQQDLSTYRPFREKESFDSLSEFENYRRIIGLSQKERDDLQMSFDYSLFSNNKKLLSEFKTIEELIGKIKVHFTTTQRLIKYSHPTRIRGEKPQTPIVEVFSSDLSKQIEITLARAMQHAQEIDSSFPRRITENLKKEDVKVNFSRLLQDLNELEKKRSRLRNTGLFLELGGDLRIDEKIQGSERKDLIGSVLKEYIKDTKEKFKEFDGLVSKLELLKGIINDRFIFKTFDITREDGFVFRNSKNETIPVNHLSSGEQQELVMFYEFLFKVPKDSLLLIDEPEISLHIDWQQKFLKDLLEVAKLVGFDVLIATHAPAIVNDYWDLTVDLAGVG